MSGLTRALIGIGVGVGLAAGGIAMGNPQATTSTAIPLVSTTTAAAPAEPMWVAGGGARFISTVVQPISFDVDDGEAILRYQLAGLGATDGRVPPILPELWRLTLVDGASFESTTDPPVDSHQSGGDQPAPPIEDRVTFADLPLGLSLADVARVEAVRWRSAVPVEIDIAIPSTVGASVRVFDGVTMVLATIIEQENGSILDFDVEAAPDPWRHVETGRFHGSGSGWANATSTFGGTGLGSGATGFQLRRTGPAVPVTIEILYSTVAWVPVEGALSVPFGGIGG